MVLDELRLVEHHPRQVKGGERLLLESHDRVRRDEEVCLVRLLGQGGATLGRGACHCPNPQVRAEALGLLHPGPDNRRGGDHENGRV